MTFYGGLMQWSGAGIAIGRVQIRALGRERRNHCGMTAPGSLVDGRRAGGVAQVHACAVRDQYLGDFDIAPIGGQMQRHRTIAVLRLHFRPAIEQHLHDRNVIGDDCVVQGSRAAFGMPRVDIGAARDQQFDGGKIAGPRRVVQGSAAEIVAMVDGGAVVEQRPHLSRVAGSRGFMQVVIE